MSNTFARPNLQRITHRPDSTRLGSRSNFLHVEKQIHATACVRARWQRRRLHCHWRRRHRIAAIAAIQRVSCGHEVGDRRSKGRRVSARALCVLRWSSCRLFVGVGVLRGDGACETAKPRAAGVGTNVLYIRCQSPMILQLFSHSSLMLSRTVPDAR
jgi:hypothetical protein